MAKKLAFAFAFLGFLGTAAAVLLPAATYVNPVLSVDFPDPMILAASDGFYYAYATGSGDGTLNRRNISVSRSRDLIHWEAPIDAMPVKPSWAFTKQNFWAPHAIERAGQYFLFYSAEPDTSPGEHLRLGVARSRSPYGPFQDLGHFIDTGGAEENLDPMVFEDPQSHRTFLYWGRDGRISVQELDSSLSGFRLGTQPVDVLGPSVKPYEGVAEGPFVIFENGWYYLFVSGDDCCNRPHYGVWVARSRSPLGPFQRLSDEPGRSDGVILRASGRWSAPGHNAVIRDHMGQWWLVYHAADHRRPRQERSADLRRSMLIDHLYFEDGWPLIRTGTPSMSPQTAPR